MKLFLSVLILVGMFTVSNQAEAAQCRVDLENGRGRVLDTFLGYGWDRYDACREARQDCRRVRRSGRYRAPIQNCVERGHRGGRRIVQRTCTARLTGPRGRRTMRTFRGSASGRIGTGVQGLACERALRQCRTVARRTPRRGDRCVVDHRGGHRGNRGGRFGISVGIDL